MKRTLVLIISFALFLRIYGINFGLPYLYNFDETVIVNHAGYFATGDLNPHYFVHPASTFMYLLFFAYVLYFIFGRSLGIFFKCQRF